MGIQTLSAGIRVDHGVGCHDLQDDITDSRVSFGCGIVYDTFE